MKKFATMALLTAFSAAHASEQSKHLISIGTDGFGWSYLNEVFTWKKDKSGINKDEKGEGKLEFNYNYIFENRLMIGGEWRYENDYSKTEMTTGSKTESELTRNTIGFSVGYNFNENLYKSWWIKTTLSAGNETSKTKASTGAKFEREYDLSELSLEVGKRFSLSRWKLDNMSYSPSIELISTAYGDDAEDAGLENSSAVTLNLLKFDVLF